MDEHERALTGRVALVTGAARGIGFATAERLSMRGADVIALDLDFDRPESADDDRSRSIRRVMVDVRESVEVERAMDVLLDQFARLDILVVCAGVAQLPTAVLEISDADWQRVIDTNLTGAFYCCRAAGRVMERQGAGAIVNVASINGVTAAPLVAAYNASKAALISLTQTLAVELAPVGVRVNVINPGPIYTELNRSVVAQRAMELEISEPEMIERIRAAIPLGRWGLASDVADAVEFLISADASWITGEILTVSGGLRVVPAGRPRGSR